MADSKGTAAIALEEDLFDSSTKIRRFTWRNANDLSIQVITYGATITSIKMPDHTGKIDDIVMGFDSLSGYKQTLNPYFGATVGRVANRVGNGQFDIDHKHYSVAKNYQNRHQLHGGFKGFDKVIWEAYTNNKQVIMSYLSQDGEEGYPGHLLTQVTFELLDNGEFSVQFTATTTKPTFVNLTNHSYFNLAGHNAGANELYKHVVCINADRTTDVDADSIPTGVLLPVANTIFDLQVPKVLGDVIHQIPGYDGYDHNFCVNRRGIQGIDPVTNTFVARVIHPDSERVLDIYSNQPGVQFYCSNSIPDDPKSFSGPPLSLQSLQGKGGCHYYKHGALCLETQNYPDAINHVNFPKAILNPGETYRHSVIYKLYLNNMNAPGYGPAYSVE